MRIVRFDGRWSSDFLAQVAKVCRTQEQNARDERNLEEEAQFLLLMEGLEGKAVEHPDTSVQKLPEKSRQLNNENELLRRFASICETRSHLERVLDAGARDKWAADFKRTVRAGPRRAR